MVCQSRTRCMMTWLMRNKWERGRTINKSRQLHHCALSVISLPRPDESHPAHGLQYVAVGKHPTEEQNTHMRTKKTKHTHHVHLRLSLMGEAGLMGSLKPHCTAQLTHTHAHTQAEVQRDLFE